MIIALTGLHGAGKGSVCKIAKNAGLASICKRERYQETHKKTGDGTTFQEWLTKQYSEQEKIELLLASSLESYDPNSTTPCVYDSVHNPVELDFLRRFDTCVLVLVKANEAIRQDRHFSVRGWTKEQTKSMDVRRYELCTYSDGTHLYDKAEYVITNNESMSQLDRSFQLVLGQIINHL